MNDDRFPRFKMSNRVKAWASRRPGPQYRPSGVAPPCVGCGGKDIPVVEVTVSPPEASEEE